MVLEIFPELCRRSFHSERDCCGPPSDQTGGQASRIPVLHPTKCLTVVSGVWCQDCLAAGTLLDDPANMSPNFTAISVAGAKLAGQR